MVSHQPKSNTPQHWLLAISVGLLSLAGAWFRFFSLDSQSYWLDEGFTVNAIMSAMERGRTILDSGINYRCVTYCYPSSWIIDLFDLSGPVGFRLLAAIAGSLMIPLIFILAREFFKDKNKKSVIDQGDAISLLVTVLVAFSYWQIAWSRQARWYTLLEITFWLSILFFWRAMYASKHRWGSIMLSLVFAVLSFQSHAAAYLLIPIFFSWLVTDKILNRKIDLVFFIKMLLGVVAVLLIVLTSDLLTASHTISGYIGGIKFSYSLPYYLSFYLRHYWPFVLIFSLSMGRGSGLEWQLTAKRVVLFLIQILIIFFLAFGLFSNIVQYRYLFIVTPAFYLLGSYGIISLFERFHGRLAKFSLLFLFAIAFFLSSHFIIRPTDVFYLESDNPALMGKRPFYAFTAQPDFKAAYDYLKSNSAPDDLIISTAPVFNKIFLGKAGYWLQYRYGGQFDQENYLIDSVRERYVTAETIADSEKLKKLIANKHGYILLDSMAVSQKMLSDELSYIRTLELVYSSEANQFSKIWIYKF